MTQPQINNLEKSLSFDLLAFYNDPSFHSIFTCNKKLFKLPSSALQAKNSLIQWVTKSQWKDALKLTITPSNNDSKGWNTQTFLNQHFLSSSVGVTKKDSENNACYAGLKNILSVYSYYENNPLPKVSPRSNGINEDDDEPGALKLDPISDINTTEKQTTVVPSTSSSSPIISSISKTDEFLKALTVFSIPSFTINNGENIFKNWANKTKSTWEVSETKTYLPDESNSSNKQIVSYRVTVKLFRGSKSPLSSTNAGEDLSSIKKQSYYALLTQLLSLQVALTSSSSLELDSQQFLIKDQHLHVLESRTLEFKQSILTGHQQLLTYCVSFANSDGGTIVYGVHDKGTVVGCKMSQTAFDEFLRNFALAVYRHTHPRIPQSLISYKIIPVFSQKEVDHGVHWPLLLSSNEFLSHSSPSDSSDCQLKFYPNRRFVFIVTIKKGPDAPNYTILSDGRLKRPLRIDAANISHQSPRQKLKPNPKPTKPTTLTIPTFPELKADEDSLPQTPQLSNPIPPPRNLLKKPRITQVQNVHSVQPMQNIQGVFPDSNAPNGQNAPNAPNAPNSSNGQNAPLIQNNPSNNQTPQMSQSLMQNGQPYFYPQYPYYHHIQQPNHPGGFPPQMYYPFNFPQQFSQTNSTPNQLTTGSSQAQSFQNHPGGPMIIYARPPQMQSTFSLTQPDSGSQPHVP